MCFRYHMGQGTYSYCPCQVLLMRFLTVALHLLYEATDYYYIVFLKVHCNMNAF